MVKLVIKIISAAIAANMLLFGVSQVSRPYKWTEYIPMWLRRLLPLSTDDTMRLHGLGNISLGLLLMSGWKIRYTSWLASAWWAFILPFCTRRHWRVGARDFSILSALVGVGLLSRGDKTKD